MSVCRSVVCFIANQFSTSPSARTAREQEGSMDASQMLAMSMQMRADAMEAQRVARNYAKAAKRSLKQVETLKQDFGIQKNMSSVHLICST